MFDENAPGTNLLDTGAHFYDVYECADGKYISLGSIEPQFYAELLRLTGLEGDAEFAKQMDKAQWPHLKERLRDGVPRKTRAEWCELMEHTDVCFAPVLTMSEAAAAPAQRRPRHVRRGRRRRRSRRRRRASRAPRPRSPSPPAHPGQHTPRGARRLGRRRRPHRRARRVEWRV